MARREIYVEHGDFRSLDEWCDDCSLPSMLEWTIFGLTMFGVYTMGTATICDECTDMDEFNELLIREIETEWGY